MPQIKYRSLEVRICRALQSQLDCSYAEIGHLTGMSPHTVKYSIRHRKSIKPESDESQRNLLYWFFAQRLVPRLLDERQMQKQKDS
jgi:hypothetical protein